MRPRGGSQVAVGGGACDLGASLLSQGFGEDNPDVVMPGSLKGLAATVVPSSWRQKP